MSPRCLRFVLLCTLCLGALSARAQYELSLKLPRANFMSQEAITATVSLVNRTGAVAVLGGPGRDNWLSFEVLTSDGQSLAQMEVDGSQLLQVPPGGVVQQKIKVSQGYAPADMGNYALKARVFHPASGDYYESNRVRFSIVDSKPMWERSFGVPEGFKDAGQPRRYAIHIFRDFDSTSLYFRLVNDKTGERLETFRLGPLNMVHDPQITMDPSNHLHVLFMAQPHLFAHAMVTPEGQLKKLSYYMDEGGRPYLAQTGKGDIVIQGGQYFDPSKPEPTQKKVGGRRVSEKPPGL